MTRSDFDDSEKDKKPKPKHRIKVRTVSAIILRLEKYLNKYFDLATISTGFLSDYKTTFEKQNHWNDLNKFIYKPYNYNCKCKVIFGAYQEPRPNV